MIAGQVQIGAGAGGLDGMVRAVQRAGDSMLSQYAQSSSAFEGRLGGYQGKEQELIAGSLAVALAPSIAATGMTSTLWAVRPWASSITLLEHQTESLTAIADIAVQAASGSGDPGTRRIGLETAYWRPRNNELGVGDASLVRAGSSIEYVHRASDGSGALPGSGGSVASIVSDSGSSVSIGHSNALASRATGDGGHFAAVSSTGRYPHSVQFAHPLGTNSLLHNQLRAPRRAFGYDFI